MARLGQNFLTDKNILALEVKILSPKNKNILEIGAGDGRLTRLLLEKGARHVYAVEKDGLLVKNFPIKNENLTLIEGDILKIIWPNVDLVIGNIPYYISSPIIFKFAKTNIPRAVFIVQKEFAEKMVAKPNEKNYGRLSVTSQLAFNIKLERTIPKHLFNPKPKVDSALLILENKKTNLNEFQETFIRILFSHKNQKIRNSLIHSKVFSKEVIEKLHIPEKRARELSPAEILNLANEIQKALFP